jgi:penicillin-binding protein 1C
MSRNVPAVALAAELERGSQPGLYDLLTRTGVASLDRPAEHYGLALVLGGGDVSLLELTGLYAMLARQGVYVPTRTLLASPASSGGTEILSKESAYLTLDILTDVARPELDAVWRSATREVPIPWKTGTSYGHRDAWSIGIAGSYVVGVWLGNFGGTGRPHLVGREVAAPLLFDLVDLLPTHEPGSWHILPSGIRFREVCALSGAPPSKQCTQTRWEAYIPGVSPTKSCSIHREICVDSESGCLVCSRCRSEGQYETRTVEWWPSQVAMFLASNHTPPAPIPPHNPACPTFGTTEPPRIVAPQPGLEVHIRPGIPLEDQQIALSGSVSRACGEMYWFLNGDLIWRGPPGAPAFLVPTAGDHRLCLKDDAGRTATTRLVVVR